MKFGVGDAIRMVADRDNRKGVVKKVYEASDGDACYYVAIRGGDGNITYKVLPEFAIEKDATDFSRFHWEIVPIGCDVVKAELYEGEGENKKLLARGHGHVFHDGDEGFVQASSWAVKCAFENYVERREAEKNG